MEKNIRNQIWPEYTSKWFKSERDSSVPHNFDTANIKANDNIKRYLLDNGLLISSHWMPDKTFHEHFKRWVGYCSAPYRTLQENTPAEHIYMSFFPFVFEVASAFFLGNFDSYITQPHFLKNGDTIVINQKSPKLFNYV